MIACLPMYDWPELRTAHDAFWQDTGTRLRASGIASPASLSRSGNDESHWLDPDLLLGQTCGYPLSTALAGKVRYLATPVYNVTGCNGPYYSSAIVVRKDSPLTMENWQGGCFAFNSVMSLSGYRSIKALVGPPETFFTNVRASGGHRNSARMVANGEADLAALDAVCWHLLQQFEPDTAAMLKIIGWTEQRPALPLITSLATTLTTIDKIREVLSDISPPAALAITGFEIMNVAEYDRLAAL
ncbi:MAG TPA: hypothetical protein ENJ55_05985 [Rhizobiales bacterium]|nr:hypothetical protein [Hyphomicrobiales bacterium]